MAKKNVQQPLPVESTEEEQLSDAEEETNNTNIEDEENEEDQSVSSSENEEEPDTDTLSGSESESISEPETVTPTKHQPLPKPLAPEKPANSPKRPARVDNNPKDAKRGKIDDNANGSVSGVKTSSLSIDDGGKKLFQRLWSEADEIVILEGFIDHATKRGKNPVSDMDSFYELIKGSFHVDVSKSQLAEKVRRLKKKYENNVKRGKLGRGRSFSKVHEQKSYDLSKKIWGSEGVVAGFENVKLNGTVKKIQRGGAKILSPLVREEFEIERHSVSGDRMVEMHKFVSAGKLDEHFVNRLMKLLEPAEAAEFERKWEGILFEELELHKKRSDLVSEHVACILERYKSKRP